MELYLEKASQALSVYALGLLVWVYGLGCGVGELGVLGLGRVGFRDLKF